MKFRSVLTVILSMALLLTLTMTAVYICDLASKRDWQKLECTITFIGLPRGDVYGDFTDLQGNEHTEEYLYTDSRFAQLRAVIKPMADPEKYIGTTTTILYDPDSGNIAEFDDIPVNIIFYTALSVIFAALGFIVIKKRP